MRVTIIVSGKRRRRGEERSRGPMIGLLHVTGHGTRGLWTGSGTDAGAAIQRQRATLSPFKNLTCFHFPCSNFFRKCPFLLLPLVLQPKKTMLSEIPPRCPEHVPSP